MSVHHLKSVQKIPVGLEEAWSFFSDPRKLLTITPPFLNLQITSRLYGTEIYPGQIITYRVKPLLGVPLFWMTEITHVERGKMFVDEQRKGPYRLWHHQHHFKEIEGGVEITDIVHYRLPFSMLGSIAHYLVVRRQLERIFTYRFEKVNKLLGPWKEEQMVLRID